jgi:hypothetical protein
MPGYSYQWSGIILFPWCLRRLQSDWGLGLCHNPKIKRRRHQSIGIDNQMIRFVTISDLPDTYAQKTAHTASLAAISLVRPATFHLPCSQHSGYLQTCSVQYHYERSYSKWGHGSLISR